MAILIFFLATFVFGYFTWRYAIVTPRAQGPFRFVAFEGIAALVLMNYAVWFASWAAPVQIVSWIFLILSIYLAIAGLMLLRGRGKPDAHFENTTQLVTTNVYRYIRHPMYASLLCLAIGAYLKQPLYWPGVVVFAMAVVAVFLTARAEEKDNLAAFGEDYAAYAKTSKMLIPFIL